ncbi:TetR family transcriptional regulator [[Mycobacterium] kokjensenii]|uniref:TetR family transcriptional regulator n=1 Tax=[Mycobacterium] kokjensenii TaxID=3064287 RepID=A0ABM9LX48_9MYCO|nr:TetR family transcriptional regulator [Mycolicibacter sp. MU0083]CAJ1506208.1 TetR family transcriptional regulator [Mycolicibacter sp. MU0083]
MPPGTTSVHFRTRKALLHGIAARMTELDVADLTAVVDALRDPDGPLAGTAGFAKIVLLSATEPYLTRSKARYELALQAGRDPELRATMQAATDLMRQLARTIVTHWYAGSEPPDPAVVDEQTTALLTLVHGVMMGFVTGSPLVDDEARLDRLLQGLLDALAPRHHRTPPD